jgi:hypothetical protein
MNNSSIEKFENLLDKRDNRLFEYLKHILLLSSSMFAILASLYRHTDNSSSTMAFRLLILLLILCILSGIIASYVSIHGYKRLILRQKEELLRQLSGNDQTARPVSFRPPPIFSICEKVCYISFVLSILCLGYYAFSLAC